MSEVFSITQYKGLQNMPKQADYLIFVAVLIFIN